MTLDRVLLVFSLAFVSQWFLASRTVAAVNVKDDGSFVIDRADVYDGSQEQKLEDWLKELEQKTGAQLKVLTVPTTDGEDIFGFAQRTAEAWQLGSKKQDDGVLVVLALRDRKVRIHTGYGIEPILPDSWCGTQSRDVANKYFRSGQYAAGLNELTLRAANRIAEAKGVKLVGVPAAQPVADNDGNVGVSLLMLVVILIVIFLANRNRGPPGRRGSRSSGGWWIVPTSTWSGGGRSFGGGGFGGGSFGGGG